MTKEIARVKKQEASYRVVLARERERELKKQANSDIHIRAGNVSWLIGSREVVMEARLRLRRRRHGEEMCRVREEFESQVAEWDAQINTLRAELCNREQELEAAHTGGTTNVKSEGTEDGTQSTGCEPSLPRELDERDTTVSQLEPPVNSIRSKLPQCWESDVVYYQQVVALESEFVIQG